MTIQAKLLCAIAVSGFAAFALTSSAQALSSTECSAKYKAAKADGSLNGQKWNDFRKAKCGADATAAPTATPAAAPAAAAPAAPAPAPAPKAAEAKPKPEAAPAAAPMPTGNAVFPSAVDPKYAKETAHMGRMHTCADQWKANKAANTTGGMHWNQKGTGGYYSECNTKLKG